MCGQMVMVTILTAFELLLNAKFALLPVLLLHLIVLLHHISEPAGKGTILCACMCVHL